MLFSPLEQFEVNSLVSLVFCDSTSGEPFALNILTNSSLFVFILFLLLWSLCKYPSASGRLVPSHAMQVVCENLLDFVGSLLKENTAARHKILLVFTPYVFLVFFFVLMSNFVGMVPYSFTVTSSLAATLSVALPTFIGVNVVGAGIHRLGFLAIFLPPGCPVFISPFIILIETVSYAARVLSLSIRLFANMMAGHTLMKILAGFAWQMVTAGGAWLLLSMGPLAIISAVCVLELAVAFLQAYVFTVLVCLYIKDAAELH